MKITAIASDTKLIPKYSVMFTRKDVNIATKQTRDVRNVLAIFFDAYWVALFSEEHNDSMQDIIKAGVIVPEYMAKPIFSIDDRLFWYIPDEYVKELPDILEQIEIV